MSLLENSSKVDNVGRYSWVQQNTPAKLIMLKDIHEFTGKFQQSWLCWKIFMSLLENSSKVDNVERYSWVH